MPKHTLNPYIEEFLSKLQYALDICDDADGSRPIFSEDRISYYVRSENKSLLSRICSSKGFICEFVPESNVPGWYINAYCDNWRRDNYKGDLYLIHIPVVIPLVNPPKITEEHKHLIEFCQFWTDTIAPCGFALSKPPYNSSPKKGSGDQSRMRTYAGKMEIAFLKEFGLEFAEERKGCFELTKVTTESWLKCNRLQLKHTPGRHTGYMVDNLNFPSIGSSTAMMRSGMLHADLKNVYNLGSVYHSNTKLEDRSLAGKQNRNFEAIRRLNEARILWLCTWSHFVDVMPQTVILGDKKLLRVDRHTGEIIKGTMDFAFRIEEVSPWEYTYQLLIESVYQFNNSYFVQPGSELSNFRTVTNIPCPVTWLQEVYAVHESEFLEVLQAI